MSSKEKKSHKCPHEGCKASFYRPYRLSQHLLVHSNVRAFACNEAGCDKSYTSKSHLDRHISRVHKEPDDDIIYSCPTCMKKYSNRQNLKRHIKLHHMVNNCFVCAICNSVYKKKNLLKSHMFQHTGVKAFSCAICPSLMFATLYEKKQHSRCHKTFTCSDCNQKFNHWSKYQKHLKTHVPEVFSCAVCGRNFKHRTHIVRHMKIHDTLRSFPCPHENCERFYSRNSNLRQHILMKHMNVKHQCNICQAQLCTMATLRKHIRNLHGENKPEPKAPKTKATGRKPRSDIGIPKSSLAIKIAGLPESINDILEVIIT